MASVLGASNEVSIHLSLNLICWQSIFVFRTSLSHRQQKAPLFAFSITHRCWGEVHHPTILRSIIQP